MNENLATILLILLFGLLCFWTFSVGMCYNENSFNKELIASGRCEYRVNEKTGETRFVWKDTGKPVK